MPNPGGHRHRGKQIGGGDADERGRSCQLPLGFDNIGPPAQEINRQTGPDAAGKRRQRARSRQLLAEIFRKLSDQGGNDVARGIDLRGKRRHLRLQSRQFAPRQRHVELVGDAAIEALLDEIHVLLGDLDVLAHHRELHLQRAQVEIGAGDVGDDRNQHHVAGGNRRLHVVLRRLDRAAELAENIDLPSGVEADNVGDLRYADAVLGGNERLRGAAAREIAAGSPAAAGASLRATAAPRR